MKLQNFNQLSRICLKWCSVAIDSTIIRLQDFDVGIYSPDRLSITKNLDFMILIVDVGEIIVLHFVLMIPLLISLLAG